jgi:hypothetical protein
VAATFIDYDKQTDVGRLQTRCLQQLREGLEGLAHWRAIAIQMRDGDGSLAAHYDVLRAEGGYQQGDYATADAAAKASFDELDSLYAVLGGGADDAILQACAKHGI